VKKKELEKSFVTSIAMGAVIVGGSKLLNFILKILVSQLGVINFGDYYLATSTFTGLTTMAALGIPMSATRFISYLTGQRRPEAVQGIIASAITITAISSVLVGIALYGYAQTIAALLGAPHTEVYLRILSFGLIGSTITLLARAVFLGYMRIHLAYSAEAVEIALKFIFTIAGIIVFRLGVLGALVGYTAGTLVAAIINTYILTRVTGIRRITPQASVGFLRFALPVGASEILTAVSGVIFLYAVGIRGGAETVGYYGAAVSIAALIHVIPQMILSVFLPTASRVFAQKTSMMPVYKTLMIWLGIAVVPPAIFLSVFSSQIIGLVFGASYTASASLLPLLVAAYGVYALLVWPNRQLLDMAGFTRENLLLTACRICTSAVLLFVVYSEFTGAGLARALLWGWGAEALGSLWLVKNKRLL